MKGRMIRDKVALKIDKSKFGQIHFDTPDGKVEIQIDTEFEKAHYYTQFSEVVSVSDNEKEIKKGMMVFHNHNVFGDARMLDTDIYWTPREFIFGTESQMFGEYVMVEKIYEQKEIVVGTVINARIGEIKDAIGNRCKVLTGKYAGKIMYCTDLMFYEIVGYARKICIAKEKQLVADLDLNPCDGKVLVKVEEDDYAIKKDSKIIVKKNYKHPNCKTGIVVKSSGDYLGDKIAYLRYYQITIDSVVYHVVNIKDIEAVLEETEQLINLN